MRASAALVAVIVTLAATDGTARQADLTGVWDISISAPTGPLAAALTVTQSGDTLTGTISSPAGDTAFTGSVTENRFTLSFEVQSPNGAVTLRMSGDYDADTVKGTFDFGQGTGDWTGKRRKT